MKQRSAAAEVDGLADLQRAGHLIATQVYIVTVLLPSISTECQLLLLLHQAVCLSVMPAPIVLAAAAALRPDARSLSFPDIPSDFEHWQGELWPSISLCQRLLSGLEG